MQCLRSGPPKVSYLAPLAASFSAPLAAFQAITGYRVLICPYYDSLGKEEPSTRDTFIGPDCTFDKVHLQICPWFSQSFASNLHSRLWSGLAFLFFTPPQS